MLNKCTDHRPFKDTVSTAAISLASCKRVWRSVNLKELINATIRRGIFHCTVSKSVLYRHVQHILLHLRTAIQAYDTICISCRGLIHSL